MPRTLPQKTGKTIPEYSGRAIFLDSPEEVVMIPEGSFINFNECKYSPEPRRGERRQEPVRIPEGSFFDYGTHSPHVNQAITMPDRILYGMRKGKHTHE